MDKLKFRAVIKKQGGNFDIHYFDFTDLVAPSFSVRKMLLPWLANDNVPDLFTGFEDKWEKKIYINDIVLFLPIGTSSYLVGKVRLATDRMVIECPNGNNVFNCYDLYHGVFSKPEIIGNKYQNPDLIQPMEKK